MINYFIGMSQEDLEAALAAARADLLAGKSTVAAASGLVSIKSEIELTPQTRIELIYQALSILDPGTYPPEQINRTNVLRVGFSQTTTETTS